MCSRCEGWEGDWLGGVWRGWSVRLDGCYGDELPTRRQLGEGNDREGGEEGGGHDGVYLGLRADGYENRIVGCGTAI